MKIFMKKNNYLPTNQCVILAGGYGSRLGDITKKTPKPLLKINNRFFIEYIIDSLERQGIKNFLIFTWYKSFHFKKLKKRSGVKIHILKEKNKLGTGGGLVYFKKFLHNSFFVVNGDTFFDVNIRDLENITNSNNHLAGVSLAKSQKHQFKFEYNQDRNYKTIFYHEKKKPKFVSGGIYFFKKNFLNYKFHNNCDLDSDIIRFIYEKKKLTSKIYTNNFIDIGTPLFLKQAPKKIRLFTKKACCYLDRDGVINEYGNYIYKVNHFVWRKNVIDAIKFLNNNNYYVIIVTNQAGIGKGIYTLKDFYKLNEMMLNTIYKNGGYVDKIYFSPHYKYSTIKKYRNGAFLRKPKPGMFFQSFKDFNIIKSKSFLIGDQHSDILAGRKVAIKSYFVQPDIYNQVKKIISSI